MDKGLRFGNYLAIGATIALMLSSCGIGQVITGQTAQERQQERKCNRATKRIDRAVTICPYLMQEPVIIYDTIRIFLPELKHDTIVMKSDTIEIIKDRWRVRIIDRIDSLYIDGGCDSIYIDVPVSVECPPQVAPTKTVPRSLAWWQIALMVLGAITVWRAIVMTFNHFENNR